VQGDATTLAQQSPDVVTYAFPVDAGAQNATLRVLLESTYFQDLQATGLPFLDVAPAAGNFTVEVRSPSGEVVGKGAHAASDGSREVKIALATFPETGEYKLRISAVGQSDGSTFGDKLVTTIFVAY
jgi:hypothetical protein